METKTRKADKVRIDGKAENKTTPGTNQNQCPDPHAPRPRRPGQTWANALKPRATQAIRPQAPPWRLLAAHSTR